MKPGPKLAVLKIPSYLDISSPPIECTELIKKIVVGEKWFDSDEVALEKAESWEAKFISYAQGELNELKRFGRHYRYEFNSSSEYLIQGASFIEPKDPVEVRQIKNNRARHTVYTDSLKQLTPTNFESLCVGVLTLLGVENPTLTPIRADQGLDFYGKLQLDNLLNPFPNIVNFTTQMSMWLIGHAKHYLDSKVSTLELRELVGSVVLAKTRAFASVQSIYEDLTIRTCDPIFFLFFTTGEITSDSWRLANKSGIIVLDGNMIANFLADQKVGVDEDGIFSKEKFDTWMSEISLQK